MGDKWHVIGEGANPVLILRKKEVPLLFTPLFWEIYHLWRLHNNGFNVLKDNADPDIMSVICDMETYYNHNYSIQAVQVKYLEALLKIEHIKLKARGKANKRK